MTDETMIDQKTIDGLDPGIRDMVVALNDAGFRTTDSGDGVSKAEEIARGDALNFAHVAVLVKPEDLLSEADRLLSWIRDWQIHDHRFVGSNIEATYYPRSQIGLIFVSALPDGYGYASFEAAEEAKQ